MAIMAGIVAGAESARRRQQRQRLRQAGSAADSAAVGSQRSSSSSSPSSSSSSSLFYHATKGNETQLNKQIVRGNNNNNNNYYYYMNKEFHDWNLGSGAREAKERLDEKLRNQRASSSVIKRRYSMVSIVGAALQKEIFSYRKSSTRRRFNWSRLAWNKNVEAKPDHAATECAVCLEEFRAGDELTHLPCAHRFHRSCAVPWLEISPHCPFCRTCIFSSSR